MSISDIVVGPAWTSRESGRYSGRYPLAVERHALAQVGRLLPGVTTVTPHARYYSLHGLVAAETAGRSIGAAAAQRLVRRCEVVMGAISTLHHDPHPGMSRAHGSDRIGPALSGGAALNVAEVASSNVYAQADWGFWGPYLASEGLLGLVEWSGGLPGPGPELDVAAVRAGLGPLLDLAEQDRIDQAVLRDHKSLCLCGATHAPDGRMLQRRLLPSDARPMELGGRRSQTIRMVLRLLELSGGVRNPQRDLVPFLLYDPSTDDDPVLQDLEITPAWRGVALRTLSVEAWRNLWAWLVGQIAGCISLAELGDLLAGALPDGTLQSHLDDLPARSARGGDAGRVLAAEPAVNDRGDPERWLDVLLLGALRSDELPERVRSYFEGPMDHRERLTPSWLRGRVEEWRGRPLRDFAGFLAQQMVHRSQQIALSKSWFDRRQGQLRIPTRVYVRDGQVFRDGGEPGSGISLRWDTLTTVLAGVGWVERAEGLWRVTDECRAL
ncbi:hypothetical protein [Microlunatus ginsengisoli]|uniref:hypothetical protein n=1 Tax=Microlunatus ginsengisoli TaxID=363863 RepID=UPI0031D5EBB4